MWWRWTAPATGPVEINTLGSEIDSRLTIYTGSTLASLVMMITMFEILTRIGGEFSLMLKLLQDAVRLLV